MATVEQQAHGASNVIVRNIEIFYNRTRRHSQLDYATPIEHELRFETTSRGLLVGDRTAASVVRTNIIQLVVDSPPGIEQLTIDVARCIDCVGLATESRRVAVVHRQVPSTVVPYRLEVAGLRSLVVIDTDVIHDPLN